MTEEEKKAAVKDFALTKGLLVALLAGVMSACFNLGLESGAPILEKAKQSGASELFALNPVILLVTIGGFITNASYCLFQNVRNNTGKDYFSVSGGTLLNNVLFCALAGVLWYSQFFGLGMGKSYFAESPVMLAFMEHPDVAECDLQQCVGHYPERVERGEPADDRRFGLRHVSPDILTFAA